MGFAWSNFCLINQSHRNLVCPKRKLKKLLVVFWMPDYLYYVNLMSSLKKSPSWLWCSLISSLLLSSHIFCALPCLIRLHPSLPYSIRLYPTCCPTCLFLPFLSSMLWPLVSPIHWIFFKLTFKTWSPGWLLFKTSLTILF